MLSLIMVLASTVTRPGGVEIAEAALEPVVARAQRPGVVRMRARAAGWAGREPTFGLVPPEGVRILDGPEVESVSRSLSAGEWEVCWTVEAAAPLAGEGRLTVGIDGEQLATSSVALRFDEFVALRELPYVPDPSPADSEYMVGAFLCPLWQGGASGGKWDPIRRFAEREPALGWYDEGDPEVTDWEIRWAVEHGISFFVVCWYRERSNLGKPVEHVLGHWIHEGLFNARFGAKTKFAILWENGNRIACGVASEEDLLSNLVPYWIERYFLQPNYLTVDGKPLLFIYRPEILVRELGGEEATRRALEKARSLCRDAGLEGVVLLGEHHGNPDASLEQMAAIGLDYAYSYHWPTFTQLMSADAGQAEIVEMQEACWQRQRAATALPSLVTVSAGWDSRPWGSSYSSHIWRLDPLHYERACRVAKAFVDAAPSDDLTRKMVLLDNWNEFGEGHFIFPTRGNGFGHLDAVRRVFTGEPEEHVDLTPEDVGLGPYDASPRMYGPP